MSTIELDSPVTRSARVVQLEGIFDLDPAERAVTRIPLNVSREQLEERPWNVGLIVGPSGAGKSTVARELFNAELVESYEWPENGALVDGFPTGMKVAEVTELLSSVGLSTPPAWVRPFSTLSNGEQFRAFVARTLAEQPELAVIDEFTSVVDRTVAKIGSAAIAKTVRRRQNRLVAVTCHFDVEEWLQPDWVYQPHVGQFTWRSLQRRPGIDVEIVGSDATAWRYFARHHYLSSAFNRAARTVVGLVEGNPAVLLATLPMPSGTVKNAHRIHRIVTMPDYQGIGVGTAVMNRVGAAQRHLGRRLYITSSHPGIVHGLNRSDVWRMTGKPKRSQKNAGALAAGLNRTASTGRVTASFEYVGPKSDELAPLFAAAR